jgi:hypothetical protein
MAPFSYSYRTRIVVLIAASLLIVSSSSFALVSRKHSKATKMSPRNEDTTTPHPFCQLPGDPSLILTTNVDLGDNKLPLMKGTLRIFVHLRGW